MATKLTPLEKQLKEENKKLEKENKALQRSLNKYQKQESNSCCECGRQGSDVKKRYFNLGAGNVIARDKKWCDKCWVDLVYEDLLD